MKQLYVIEDSVGVVGTQLAGTAERAILLFQKKHNITTKLSAFPMVSWKDKWEVDETESWKQETFNCSSWPKSKSVAVSLRTPAVGGRPTLDA